MEASWSLLFNGFFIPANISPVKKYGKTAGTDKYLEITG
jgi:hypothetical protein